jgi:hypothetical protein
MYPQTEYNLAYALVAAFVVLGMLVVCIPRPRKSAILSPEQIAKEKQLKARAKMKAKAQKDSDKAKKKKQKARAKKRKSS